MCCSLHKVIHQARLYPCITGQHNFLLDDFALRCVFFFFLQREHLYEYSLTLSRQNKESTF